jgi:hypothetical protein
MDEKLLLAFVALASAILGGALQALFQQRHARVQAVRQQKIDAYASYFKGVALLSHGQNAQEIAQGNAIISEARGRVALYGSREVIEAMTAAFRCGPISNQDMAVHAQMIKAMRVDANLGNGEASDQALFEMLYGEERKRS